MSLRDALEFARSRIRLRLAAAACTVGLWAPAALAADINLPMLQGLRASTTVPELPATGRMVWTDKRLLIVPSLRTGETLRRLDAVLGTLKPWIVRQPEPRGYEADPAKVAARHLEFFPDSTDWQSGYTTFDHRLAATAMADLPIRRIFADALVASLRPRFAGVAFADDLRAFTPAYDYVLIMDFDAQAELAPFLALQDINRDRKPNDTLRAPTISASLSWALLDRSMNVALRHDSRRDAFCGTTVREAGCPAKPPESGDFGPGCSVPHLSIRVPNHDRIRRRAEVMCSFKWLEQRWRMWVGGVVDRTQLGGIIELRQQLDQRSK